MTVCDRVRKSWLFVGIIVVASIYVLFTTFCDVGIDTWRSQRLKIFVGNFDRKNETTSAKRDTKKILFWNGMFGDKNFYFGNGDLFRNCPEKGRNCFATHQRSYANVQDFDAILFHGIEIDTRDLPSVRDERQYYVYVNLESPENRPIEQPILEDHFFNLTMTYRLDSDIVRPYGAVSRIRDGTFVAPSIHTVWDENDQDLIGSNDTSATISSRTWDEHAMIRTTMKKKKMAVWFVSNCQAKSKRTFYAQELARHIDLDIFGHCGSPTGCPNNNNCFGEFAEPRYYFYLSFENTMCQDYVTEKLYKVLKYYMVPIVYGGANYSLFAPPKSYINALDFESPKELADYLKSLIAEPTEYMKYFEWKKTYEIVTSTQRTICQLCEYLHENKDTKSYSPLSAWYSEGKCPWQRKIINLSYLTKKDIEN